MEDCKSAHLIPQGDCLVFSPDADMSVTEVELFFKELTLGLSNFTYAAELLISSVLYLHHQRLFIDSGSRRVEQDGHSARFTGWNDV